MSKQSPVTKRCIDLVYAMTGAVQAQFSLAISAFVGMDEKQAESVIDKDDFIDNLHVYSESEFFKMMQNVSSEEIDLIKTSLKMVKGLEKIADNIENIAKQTLFLIQSGDRSLAIDILGCYQVAKDGINLAVEGFVERNIKKVKRAAKKEAILDDVYTDIFKRTLDQLGQPDSDAGFLITQLLLSKYVEKIGDTILDMAEATLMLMTGERLKIHQYVHMTRLIKSDGLDDTELEGFWGTRSGSSIFRLDPKGEENLIYKEGEPKKIKQEIAKLKRWEEIEPGLVPQVISTSTHQDRQIIVTQFFEGTSLADVYKQPWWREKEIVTRLLIRQVESIWAKTIVKRRQKFTALSQLRSRLDAVYAMHPPLKTLRNKEVVFCGIEHPPLGEILDRLEQFEDDLRAPFSVFIHGDFNTDNILYQPEKQRVRFIDVHRSGMGDYLQDVSVFIVSGQRSPAFSMRMRLEYERVNQLIESFAWQFAELYGDKRFEERFDLMVARSQITSARFITSYTHARRLFLNGVQKLEGVLHRLEKEKK